MTGSAYLVPLPLSPYLFFAQPHWLPCCLEHTNMLLLIEPLNFFHLPGMLSHHIFTYLIDSLGLFLAEFTLLTCLHFVDNAYYLKVYNLLLNYVSADTKVNATYLQRYLFIEVCQDTFSKRRASCFTLILHH